MKEALAFDDVQIVPTFSGVYSRKDVDLTTKVAGQFLKLPVISSNMDTVTEVDMAKAMSKSGGVGCLHRFQSIEDNVKMFKESGVTPWVSIGLGSNELERAKALKEVGATVFVVDVAHGASMGVVNQVNELSKFVDNIVVGNFATAKSIQRFREYLNNPDKVKAYKIGIGGGSACTTRIETGVGIPTLQSILDCSSLGIDLIADGGLRTPGDIAKALAAGAKAVMLGGMLSGTDETPGNYVDSTRTLFPENILERAKKDFPNAIYKKYRGSASKESYVAQGKDESWRTPEGEAFLVKYKGPVANVLSRIEGGLRSNYSYVGAFTTKELQENTELIRITNAGTIEAKPHGK